MPDTQSRAVEIVQITDMHLTANENSLLKGVNTAETLTKVLAAVEQASYDRLIATGDISEDFSPASYRLFLTLLARHRIASLVCLSGNHDDPAVMQQILQPVALPTVFCEREWLFVCLNTTLSGEDEGEIAADDLVMLEELLVGHSASYVVLFMHHHAVPVESRWIDRYGLRNSASLMALLARHNKVRAVISGHVHQASETERNGVLFYTTPATSLQFVPYSDQAEVATASPAWRKWFFWPDGRITNQLFFL
ncbi:MAG: metallophosphoesterase [Serratia inhibens]|uniref:metallophosphoesterase n=1 Tax=Serratia inhibens TaxID=2338073 RepID=UPI003C7D16A2